MDEPPVMLRKKSQMQKTMYCRDFPGSPAVRTLCFQCRVSGLIPGGRTKDPMCSQKKKKIRQEKERKESNAKERGQRLHALHPPTPPFTVIRPRDLGIGICKQKVGSVYTQGLWSGLVQFLCSVVGETEAQGGSGSLSMPELTGPGLRAEVQASEGAPSSAPALHSAYKLLHGFEKEEFINLATFWNNRTINGHARGKLGDT